MALRAMAGGVGRCGSLTIFPRTAMLLMRSPLRARRGLGTVSIHRGSPMWASAWIVEHSRHSLLILPNRSAHWTVVPGRLGGLSGFSGDVRLWPSDPAGKRAWWAGPREVTVPWRWGASAP